VARLVPIKGHEIALKAIARCVQDHRPVEYHIVGDGPLKSSLQRLAADLGLQNQARFHGACVGADLAARYRDAHLFLLPSVNIEGDAEGQGLVLQEAQAWGLPVITTHHGGLPEGIVPGQSGILVPEGNVNALAAGIARLADHPEQWQSMGRAGRQFVASKYDLLALNRRLVEVYRHAITRMQSEVSCTSPNRGNKASRTSTESIP
jgi:colanic acid/amylovoran biosynthesis glycosyltransferase